MTAPGTRTARGPVRRAATSGTAGREGSTGQVRSGARAFDGVLLVAATGLVCSAELAILVRCLTVTASPAATAAVLAAFHLGYLAADRVRSGRRLPMLLAALGTACALLAAALVRLDQAAVTAVALGAAGAVFNTAAQAVRRSLKKDAGVSIPAKNAGKAIGMVLGGAAGAWAWTSAGWFLLAAPCCLAAAWAAARRGGRSHSPAASGPERPGPRRGGLLLAAELLHHAHYFAYVYTFWFVAPALIGPLSGVWFLLGWLAYFVAEAAWRERRRAFSPAVMAVGHLAVAAMVLLMPHLPAPGVLAAWFVTGIGGGTAYMLGNVEPQGGRERYEDTGHVAGALAAALVGGLSGGSALHGATATLVAAASLACAAGGTFWLARRPTPPLSEGIA